uniref:tRNA (adenine(58)-N(1))-methyltransferase non-catalytic subunit TRM6 n=1 Tax=Chromera velia CCMP2878 TaxID=1169474 RepID=A0A0G4G8V6_9ALVE|eukprot:Cvel_20759.t1-p1 / transcript=Cvel_20759.t1 / gene=Cvel_20759 / organism=Chromera_velia_CCMP2878 / gene_product=tRNA (adenine(58)-N(1))-methyltransferase, putative / transcript_product=tRNA (adenine(58)-N(1))-methyltransferase, putative / location=Cvel_scaffold1892:17647-22479(+) / protein_length=592 / sequence_SO=supercontig / SO=protein_coding / is_pseudo=false
MADGDLKFGKMKIPVQSLHGLPLGATLRLEGREWTRTQRLQLGVLEGEGGETAEGDETTEVTGDNRNLVDDNSAQQLSAEDIAKLKENATSSKDVVAAIAKNSATFQSKTSFSKAKYIAKKQRRHVQQVTVLPASLDAIVDAFNLQHPSKSCCVRTETLSSALLFANLHAGGRALLFDQTGGIVAGAAVRRLGCRGGVSAVVGRARLFCLVEGGKAGIEKAGYFNLSGEEEKILKRIPASLVLSDPSPLLSSDWKGSSLCGESWRPLEAGAATQDGGGGTSGGGDVEMTYAGQESSSASAVSEEQRLEGLLKARGERGAEILKLAAQSRWSFPPWLVGSDGNKEGGRRAAGQVKNEGEGEGEEEKVKEEEGSAAAANSGSVGRRRGAEREKKEGEKSEEQREAERVEKRKQWMRDGLTLQDDIRDLAVEGVDAIVVVVASQGRGGAVDVSETVERFASVSTSSLLNPGGRLVILSSGMQPLSSLLARLQASPRFCAVRLQEFFIRDHQVLPQRTHPVMKESRLFEGFLLSAIRVWDAGEVQQRQKQRGAAKSAGAGAENGRENEEREKRPSKAQKQSHDEDAADDSKKETTK